MERSSNIGLIHTLFVWAAVGLLIGLWVGVFMVLRNDSVRQVKDAIVLCGWVSTSYGLAFACAGIIVFISTRILPGLPPARILASAAQLRAAVLFFVFASGLHWLVDDVVAWEPALVVRRTALMLTVLFCSSAAGAYAALFWAKIFPSPRPTFVRAAALIALMGGVTMQYAIARARTTGQNTTVHLPRRSELSSKVILIGIDGADLRKIDPLIEKGRLPHLDMLSRTGVVSRLRTTRPTWSPILWTTVATGVEESKHGIRGFTEFLAPGMEGAVQRLPRTASLINHLWLREIGWLLLHSGFVAEAPVSVRHRRVKALWNVLSEQGCLVGVVNWYASWPSERVNGYIVSDNNPWRAAYQLQQGSSTARGREQARITHPPSLLAEIAKYSNSVRLPRSLKTRVSARDVDDIFHIIQETDRFVASASQYLLAKKKVEFLALYLSGIDNVSHRYSHLTGLVDQYYEYVDTLVGAILEQASTDTTVIIVSDHGWDYNPENFGHNHAPDGILIMHGPPVKRGVRLEPPPTLVDIAPTLLHLMGFPLSRELDGQVIREALKPSAESTPVVAAVESYGTYAPPERPSTTAAASAGADEILRKLKALGYLK